MAPGLCQASPLLQNVPPVTAAPSKAAPRGAMTWRWAGGFAGALHRAHTAPQPAWPRVATRSPGSQLAGGKQRFRVTDPGDSPGDTGGLCLYRVLGRVQEAEPGSSLLTPDFPLGGSFLIFSLLGGTG